jgi:hypothetical protein
MEPWVIAVESLTAFGLVGGGVLAGFRLLRRIDKKLSRFQEDWEGTPGRPGVPPRAGVMERLSVIEIVQGDTNHRIDELRAEVRTRRR